MTTATMTSTTTPRRSPYIWATWIVGLLSGDDVCQWAAWFRAHYDHEPQPRAEDDVAKLATWRIDHTTMVEARADQLRALGWTVYVEAQNKFFLDGKAATLAGTPDIIAIAPDRTHALVIDCKTGKRRDKDQWQVRVYLMAIPHTKHPAAGLRLGGAVEYRDGGIVPITETYQDRIVAQIQRTSGPTVPPRSPSARECSQCAINPTDCPERMTAAEHRATVDLF